MVFVVRARAVVVVIVGGGSVCDRRSIDRCRQRVRQQHAVGVRVGIGGVVIVVVVGGGGGVGVVFIVWAAAAYTGSTAPVHHWAVG